MNSKASLAMETVLINTTPEARYGISERGFQGIPGIERTPQGRLWATWYSGGVTEGPTNFVLLATSGDDGESWSEPIAVVDPPGNVRAYDPVLWMDPENRLWLFWSQCYTEQDHTIFDGVAGVWGAWTKDIESDSPAWSTPMRIANGIMMNKPTVLSNGEWAFPTAVWLNKGKGQVPERLLGERFSNITISTDKGRTFSRRGGADVPDRAYDEHMIVERNDGRLWMLVRTSYGIGQSFSEDGGKTWSDGEPSGLNGADSRFFIRRLASGRLLLVYHDITKVSEGGNKRQALTAWLSEDDGASWDGGLLLDERESISYPDGIEDEAGNITIIYDHNRYKEGDILIARFTEGEVLAGRVTVPTSFLKRCISHTGGVGCEEAV
jgi:predicted neuraminidase